MGDAGLLRQRFAKRTTIKLHCLVVTPMFLGDAKQEASLRPEPFKGLLRYWWRVAAGREFSDHEKLLEKESELFGGGGESARKSLVTVEVEGIPRISNSFELPQVQEVFHPEVGERGRSINPLLYLGYGPVTWKQGKAQYTRSYIKPGEEFSLRLTLSESCLDDTLKLALVYLMAFGAIGSRCRNGWGSFQVVKIEPKVKSKVSYRAFSESLFERDYPFVLAAVKQDDKLKPLIWKTKTPRSSWQDTMRDLAEIYISVRTKLDTDGKDDIGERHLLGFPLTNHYASRAPGWGAGSRHASPLRFFVRKKGERYTGFVFHLPFGISERMRRNASGEEFFTPSKQFEIWQKVHKSLDQLMQRASIKECL